MLVSNHIAEASNENHEQDSQEKDSPVNIPIAHNGTTKLNALEFSHRQL